MKFDYLELRDSELVSIRAREPVDRGTLMVKQVHLSEKKPHILLMMFSGV